MIYFKPKKGLIYLFLLFLCLGGNNLRGSSRAEAKDFVFPEVSGWKKAKLPLVFSPDKLYEYINGAADLYLRYEFQELKVAEYQDEKKAFVTVEIYRHKTPLSAFGVYSQERLANAKFLDIGAQGYREPAFLNFLTGPYYVKISGYNTGLDDEKILLTFARKIEEILGVKTSLPAILSAFPPEGKKKNSEKFISKDFLGYSFFHSGYTADYELSGKKFKIFVIEGKNPVDCRQMMENYLKQTGMQPKKAEEGAFRLKDPFQGEVDLFWKGKFIWGILDLDDPGLRSRYLRILEDFFKKF